MPPRLLDRHPPVAEKGEQVREVSCWRWLDRCEVLQLQSHGHEGRLAFWRKELATRAGSRDPVLRHLQLVPADYRSSRHLRGRPRLTEDACVWLAGLQ